MLKSKEILVPEPNKINPEEIQSAYDGLRNSPHEYIGVVIDWRN